MSNLTISIFGNKIFLEIINEIKLFSKFNLKFYDNLDLYTENTVNHDQLVIFFIPEANVNFYKKIKNNSFPLIVIGKSPISHNILLSDFVEKLNIMKI